MQWPRAPFLAFLAAVGALLTVASAAEQSQNVPGPLSRDAPMGMAVGPWRVGAFEPPDDRDGACGGPAWGDALDRGPAPNVTVNYVACTSTCRAGNSCARFRRHFNPYHHLDRPLGLETTAAGAGGCGAAAAEEEEELGSAATRTGGLLHHARRLVVHCLACRHCPCHCVFCDPFRACSCLSSYRLEGLAQRSAAGCADGGATCDVLSFSRVDDGGADGDFHGVVAGRDKCSVLFGGVHLDLRGRPPACMVCPSVGRVRRYLDPRWSDEAVSSADQRVYLQYGPGQGILPRRGDEGMNEESEEKARKVQYRLSDFNVTVKVEESRRFRDDQAGHEERDQDTCGMRRRNHGTAGRCWRSLIYASCKVHARAEWNVHISNADVVMENGEMKKRGTMRWVISAVCKAWANARYPQSQRKGSSGRSLMSVATKVSPRGNVHRPDSEVVEDNGIEEIGRAIVHWTIVVPTKVAAKARYLRPDAKEGANWEVRKVREDEGAGSGDGGLDAQCSLQATQGTHHHRHTVTQKHFCEVIVHWSLVHMSRCRPVLVSWCVTRCTGLAPDKGDSHDEERGGPVLGVSSWFVRVGSHGQHGGTAACQGQGGNGGAQRPRRRKQRERCPHARRRGGQRSCGETREGVRRKLFRCRYLVRLLKSPTDAYDNSHRIPVYATARPQQLPSTPATHSRQSPHGPSGHCATRDAAASLEGGEEGGAWTEEEFDHHDHGGRGDSAWHCDASAPRRAAPRQSGCLCMHFGYHMRRCNIGDGIGKMIAHYYVRLAGDGTRSNGDTSTWRASPKARWCDGDPRPLLFRPDVKLEAGSTRFGEARHPGPAQAGACEGGDAEGHDSSVTIGPVQYRNPFQQGFHGALITGCAAAHADAQGGSASAGLSIVTCNSTAWGPLRRFLRRTRADIVMAQEHHLAPSDVPAKSAWALRNKWHSVIAPAQPGEGSGWRAGVAIFARPNMGLCHPRAGSHIVVPHRAVAASVHPPGYRPITLVSVYLEDGKGVGSVNLAHLSEVGNFLNCQGDQVPFVVAGDFQSTPDEVAATGLAASVGGELVACGTPRGTCRTSRTASEIDFFIVSKMLAVGIREVATVENAGTRPHVPVELKFAPKLVTARALILRQPPQLATERVYGPLPPPPRWSDVAAYINDIVVMARADDFDYDDDFKAHYEAAYEAWADLAEIELVAATEGAQAMPKFGTRGRRPQLRWRSVLPERPPEPLEEDTRLTRWRDLANLLSELRRVAWAVDHAGADEDADDELEADYADHDPRAQVQPHSHVVDLHACINSIREQLDDLGPLAHIADMNDDDGDGRQDEQLVTYGGAVVRMRALAGALSTALRNYAVDESANGTGHGAGIPGLGDHVNELAEEVARRLDQVAAAARKAHASKWKDWIMTNLHAGARNAHRFLRLPEEWRPTTVLDPDGVLTAAPTQLLEGYADKYSGLWNGHARAQCTAAPRKPWQEGGNTPLARPTPEDIRAAAKTFSTTTAVAYDGFAMRHYALLSNEALEALADIIEVTERTGMMPPQLGALAMPLLAKPRGGHRAIATFVSLYRLWSRIRRDEVRKWEGTIERPYFAAGSGKAPQDAVWRQAARAEAAVATSACSATLLWDLSAFFESLRRMPLWFRARRLGFPLTVAAVSFNAYGAVRLLALGGVMARPLIAEDGIPAGCAFAMALTKAYCVEAFDRATDAMAMLARIPPSLCVYVDDIAVSMEGSRDQVIEGMGKACEILKGEIEGPLACRVEIGKAAVVASTARLARILRGKFGEYSGPGADAGSGGSAATNLGIDFAAGRQRRTHGIKAKRKQRLRKLGLQTGRIARLRAVAGKRTSSIFVAGPLSSATYGAAVNGLTDAEVLRIRRAAAHAYTPRAKGRSLRRLLLVMGVPTWKAEIEVLLQYARETWSAVLLGPRQPTNGQMTLPQIDQAWRAVQTGGILGGDGSTRNWGASRGPLTAAHLTLHRIGWKMKSAFIWTSDLGDDVVLTKTSPQLLAHMLRDAVTRTLQRQVGQAFAGTDNEFDGRRATAEHVAAQLRSDRKLGPRDRAAYLSVACNALMTYDRASKCGYIVANKCPKCGEGPDTPFHRVWKCCSPEAVAAREAAAPLWLRREAERAENAHDNIFWVTGFIPHPADIWPRPSDSSDAIFEWSGIGEPAADDRDAYGKPHVKGKIYIDGSCTSNVFSELRRAASSIVQWSYAAPGGWKVHYPVPRTLPQTPQAAEYVALGLTRMVADKSSKSDVASDCANVVRDATGGHLMSTRASKMYAAINRENLGDVGWARNAVVRKVPAHVRPEAAPEGTAREDAIGNDMADAAAKAAVKLHDQPTPVMEQQLASVLRRAKLVVRTIAAVTQTFPPMPRERLVRPPRPTEGSQIGVEGGHAWCYAAGMWRCATCLKLTLSPTIGANQLRERCKGLKGSLTAETITARGHHLAKTTGDVAVLFCVKCGSFATRRAYGLAAACPGKPTPAGRQALARIKSGHQPWAERGAGAYRRLMSQKPLAWDASRSTFVDIGPKDGNARRRRSRHGQCADIRRDGPLRHGDGADGAARDAGVVPPRFSRRDPLSGDSVTDAMMEDGDTMEMNCTDMEEEVVRHGVESDGVGSSRPPPHHDETVPSHPDSAVQGPRGTSVEPRGAEEDDVGWQRNTHLKRGPQMSSGTGCQDAALDINAIADAGMKRARRSSGTSDDLRDQLADGKHACGPAELDLDFGVQQFCAGSEALHGYDNRVQANITAHSDAVARVGPRGADLRCATAAAAPSVLRAAAAAVAEEAATTILRLGTNARDTVVERGKVVKSPASGSAVPLEDSRDVHGQHEGRDHDDDSHNMPLRASGGSPQKRRRLKPPLNAPRRLGAGPSSSEREGKPGYGKRSPGVERRRDGDSIPAAADLAARGCDVAAERGGGKGPQRGPSQHIPGAQKTECPNDATMEDQCHEGDHEPTEEQEDIRIRRLQAGKRAVGHDLDAPGAAHEHDVSAQWLAGVRRVDQPTREATTTPDHTGSCAAAGSRNGGDDCNVADANAETGHKLVMRGVGGGYGGGGDQRHRGWHRLHAPRGVQGFRRHGASRRQREPLRGRPGDRLRHDQPHGREGPHAAAPRQRGGMEPHGLGRDKNDGRPFSPVGAISRGSGNKGMIGPDGVPFRSVRDSLLQRRGARGRGQRRGHAGAGDVDHQAPAAARVGHSGAPGGQSLDEGEWILPWERPPSWLYLPHLVPVDCTAGGGGDVTCAEEPNVSAGDRRSMHEEGLRHATHFEQRDDNPLTTVAGAPRRCERPISAAAGRHQQDLPLTAAVAPACGGTSLGRKCDALVISGAGRIPVGRDSRAPSQLTSHDPANPHPTDAEVHAIRGRRSPLGPVLAREGADRSSQPAAAATVASLPAQRLTNGGVATRSNAQARLDAANAHLSISLQDHSERVTRRRARQQSPERRPSAAERLAALRRRVAARTEVSTRGATEEDQAPDGGAGAGNQCGIATI